jgi:hypothetical protein
MSFRTQRGRRKTRKPDQIIVGAVQLDYDHFHEEPERGRQDHYYKGQVYVNNKLLPFELHLMHHPEYDKKALQDGNKLYTAIIEINGGGIYDGHKLVKHDCNRCTGNTGGNGDADGPLALALWQPIINMVCLDVCKRDGVKLFPAVYKSNKESGWYSFYHYVPIVGEETRKPARQHFYHKSLVPVDCPIHGQVVNEDVETDL